MSQKIIPTGIVLSLFLSVAAFAQDDLSTEATEPTSEASVDTTASEAASTEEASDAAEALPAASAANEWEGFDYQHAGLTQSEFQAAKESGMSRSKLENLLEIGISPAEYLSKPWTRLGVTEEKWLKERESGMADGDIDRTYVTQSGNQGLAYLSFLVPSLYQWNAGMTAPALTIDLLEAASIAGTIVLWATAERGDNSWVYGAVAIAAVHAGSGIHAVVSTKNDNNPDAARFAWGVLPVPTSKGKPQAFGFASYRF